MLSFLDLRQHSGLWLFLCCSEVLLTCWGMSVSFPYKAPIYVAQGRKLVLQAQIKRNPEEIVSLVTWDLKIGSTELRIDTIKNQGANNVLKKEINSGAPNRYGIYMVTVTDHNGDQVHASVEVRESLNPPQASLSLQCSLLPQGMLWDTPEYSWWMNGTKVTNQTAQLSSDGSQLYITSLQSNYTCVIDSSQGTSSVQISRDLELDPKPCPGPTSCGTAIAFAVIEAIVIAVISIWLYILWRKKKN